MSDVIAIANRYIAAYNAKDLDAIRGLLTDDVHMEHHNRGGAYVGRDFAVATIEKFAGVAPDRRFHSIRRQYADGQTVITELAYEATLSADMPGFAKRGDRISQELACIWTMRDGRIAEYHDYG